MRRRRLRSIRTGLPPVTNRVLISGATGLIGNRLIDRLSRDGISTRCLSRSVARGPHGTVEFCHWDGLQLPPDAIRECNALVHLSGESVFGGLLTAARRNRILESRVESTRAIVAAIDSLPADERPSTLICASAVGFYGSRGEEALDESAAAGSGFLANVCEQWEAAALAAESSGVRVVPLRIGIVIAREAGALPMMALPFRFGFGGRTGPGTQWVPWIHIDDLIALITRILSDDRFSGPVNAVAPNPVRNTQLSTAIAQALGRPCWLPVPAFVLRLGLGDLSDELLGSRLCVPKAALDLGFEFGHNEIETALEAELG
jgi:uncharacterized protein (TIGR01777 family)